MPPAKSKRPGSKLTRPTVNRVLKGEAASILSAKAGTKVFKKAGDKLSMKHAQTGELRLTRVGGSRAMIVPPAILSLLSIKDDTSLVYAVLDGKMVVEKKDRRPTLAELCADCDPTAPLLEEDEAWFAGGPVGREEI